jgi:peptidoglycan hydrolase-like protein with peptidoglycan-binding domain
MPSGISPGGRPIDESPLSTSKTDNWVARAGGLPPYVRGIARGIAKKHGGDVTSADIAMAWEYVKKLAATSKDAKVRAAASAAVAQEKDLQMRNRAKDLAGIGPDDIELDWSSFDSARGKHPRQKAAQPVAPTGTVAGYTGANMPPQVVAAIQKFQHDNHLPVTGNLDQATVAFAQQYPEKVAAAKAATQAAHKAQAAASKAQAAKNKQAAIAKKAANAQKAAAKKVIADKKAAAAKVKAVKQKAIKTQINNTQVDLVKARVNGNKDQVKTLTIKIAQLRADYANV